MKAFDKIQVSRVAPEYSEEHFLLFERYISSRHEGGGMDDDISTESYSRFLVGDVCHTFFAEFRDEGKLVGIAVVDTLSDGLSAVYTFFEPDPQYGGLGTFAILWQIERTRLLRFRWLYLGYWIEESRKMAYKNNFRPYQIRRDENWISD